MSADLTDEQRVQEIRERYPVAANPYGRMAIRDLLRLLDAERAKVAQLTAPERPAHYHGSIGCRCVVFSALGADQPDS